GITDFGTSRIMSRQRMTLRIGTPAYMAPELLGSGHHNYSHSIDIYRCVVYNYLFHSFFF
ncbi:MAG: hypothetical protein Q8P67_29170, partial [archaeon]|nr:hypothetical protein [archaeon]